MNPIEAWEKATVALVEENKTMRKRLAEIRQAQIELEAAFEDFHQGALYDSNAIPVFMRSGYPELRDAIAKMVEA